MRELAIIVIASLVFSLSAHAQTTFAHVRGETNPLAGFGLNPPVLGTPNYQPRLKGGKSTTLFEGGYRTGGFCNFDLVETVTHVFETIPELLEQMLPLIALGIGISFVCKTFPNECALTKNLMNYANLLLRMQQQTCTQVVQSAMYDGIAASNDALGACLRDSPPGEPQTVTFNRCYGDPGGIPLPNGERAGIVPVFSTILDTVGVDGELRAGILRYAGEVTYRADGQVFSTVKQVPGEAPLALVGEKLRLRTETITKIVDTLRSGGVPSTPDLIIAQFPGNPITIKAYMGIASEGDPLIRETLIQTLASQVAYAQAQWDLLEFQTGLEKAAAASNITPTQRETVQQMIAALKSDIKRVRTMKQIIDESAPVIQDLMARREAQLRTAAGATISVTPKQIFTNRYDGQSSWGYSR